MVFKTFYYFIIHHNRQQKLLLNNFLLTGCCLGGLLVILDLFLIMLLSDVDVCVDGRSNVAVTDLQNERIMVTSESGDCLLSNVQVNTIQYNCI